MSVLDIFELETWDKQAPPVSEDSDEKIEDDPLSAALSATEAAATVATPFPVRHDLNAKICLWFVV